MFPSPTMTHSLPGYFRDQDDLGDLYEDVQKMCLGMIGSRDGVVVQKLGGVLRHGIHVRPTGLSLYI